MDTDVSEKNKDIRLIVSVCLYILNVIARKAKITHVVGIKLPLNSAVLETLSMHQDEEGFSCMPKCTPVTFNHHKAETKGVC